MKVGVIADTHLNGSNPLLESVAVRDNVLYFNPGAFSCGLPSLWRRSVGLLTIDRDPIQGHIVRG